MAGARNWLGILCLLLALELCFRAVQLAGARPLVAVFLSFWAGTLPLVVAELVAPAAPHGKHYLRGIALSLVFTLSIFLWAQVSAYVVSRAVYPLVKWNLARDASTPLIVFAVLLGLFVQDFFHYWFHVACHKVDWLWRIHRPHHAIRDFNCFGYYGHILGPAIQIPLMTIPFTFFFGVSTPHQVALLTSFTMAWNYFIHSNTTLNLGWLGAIICDNAHHKIHHSLDPRHIDKNFAIFPLWDMLFGTYCKPEPMETVSVGVEGLGPTRLQDIFLLTAERLPVLPAVDVHAAGRAVAD